MEMFPNTNLFIKFQQKLFDCLDKTTLDLGVMSLMIGPYGLADCVRLNCIVQTHLGPCVVFSLIHLSLQCQVLDLY